MHCVVLFCLLEIIKKKKDNRFHFVVCLAVICISASRRKRGFTLWLFVVVHVHVERAARAEDAGDN